MSKNIEIISNNRKAFHSYTIINRYEAGMILLGSEVKSLREKKLNLKDSFVSIKDEKVWLIGAHISSYSHTGFSGHSPTRNRELLLHKKEMIRLKNIVAQKGLTIVPLKAYFKGGIAKIEFATAKGKKTYQKKDALKMRDLDREARREMSKK
ncbi:MAG: SsrA-binding protein [Candidatus Marinimicrobia bacterium]|jgi:SsrA-binding protein|nr:SsrA-binding protein [Candidatus Neomarinimicrobiota bacterium]|tara:strand:+ start:6000 stop:6455 length:456 start_codon:yes stop_codon:yes gene_type:complete